MIVSWDRIMCRSIKQEVLTMKEIVNVQGMSCMNCVKSIERSVGQLDGVNEVNVKLDDA